MKLAVAFSIALVGRRWKARFAALVKPSGNTNSRAAVLYFLADAPKGLTQAELSELLSISPATLTRMLDGMEGRGMISRRALIGDRRAKLVFIEDKGRADLEDLDKAAGELRDSLLDGVPAEDLRTTLSVLRVIEGRLSDKGEAAGEDFTPR
ncbi:MarR family winged helix-turn-helix transcriptional regulator [Brevundimonas sp. PAMC22021]|uniref:MarR family winged helix-turn-helix transcriptional regulator n=1 Tax=Brevundimonas sp. PAMC22021 TaxID=2861285 RepID=UPI001C6399E3|nr:MarR family transcriptional regulator [Brevundimonas sp. PAMC22021]QYF86052.1 MarR family transcriptional regulator [Brevundimonas sp. PAMC22021]